jgi:MoaA/NifB/PqqE/SkfB family radical SAM enzyme
LPYKLTFVLTYKCNSKCKICQIWKKKPHGELETKEINRFFKKNQFFNWVDLTGGEVFLHPKLVKITKIILDTQKNLVLLHIPTNGLLPEKIIRDTKAILEFEPKRFLISIALDGPEKVHDNLRGTSGNWRKAVETFKGLRKLKSKNFNCYFGMTLSKYNHNLIEETYQGLRKQIKDLNRRDLHYNIAHHSEHYYRNLNADLGFDKKFMTGLRAFRRRKKMTLSTVQFLVYNQFLLNLQSFYSTFHKDIYCLEGQQKLKLKAPGNEPEFYLFQGKQVLISDKYSLKIEPLTKSSSFSV